MGERPFRCIDSRDSSDVVHTCHLFASFPASQWPSDSSVSITTLLQAVHISLLHRAHVFLTFDNVFYIRDLAWLCATLEHVGDLVKITETAAKEKWYAAARLMHSGFGAAIFSST